MFMSYDLVFYASIIYVRTIHFIIESVFLSFDMLDRMYNRNIYYNNLYSIDSNLGKKKGLLRVAFRYFLFVVKL